MKALNSRDRPTINGGEIALGEGAGKLTLQQQSLELIKGEQLASDCSEGLERFSVLRGRVEDKFDVLGNLRLLPKFNERDRDSFFSSVCVWAHGRGKEAALPGSVFCQ